MICPECKGSGKSGPAFVRRSDGSCRIEEINCTTCSGRKTMPDEYPQWREIGRRMMEDRRRRRVSLSDEARRRGMLSSELSAMEFGKIQPRAIWYCSNNVTRSGCPGHEPDSLRCTDLG